MPVTLEQREGRTDQTGSMQAMQKELVWEVILGVVEATEKLSRGSHGAFMCQGRLHSTYMKPNFNIFFFFFLSCLFAFLLPFHLKGRMTVNPLLHSPNAHNSWG